MAAPRKHPDRGSGRSLQAGEVKSWTAVDLPLPGTGQTLQRWLGLRALGRADLSLAKVVEPHHDAQAICVELGHRPPEPGTLWQVWAAEPPGAGVVATGSEGGWLLNGPKPFCSGALLASHALVTADVDGSSGLFAVDVRAAAQRGQLVVAAPTWAGAGMLRADTRTVEFASAPAVAVGSVGEYSDRPGFWHGSIGVAACWTGGAYGVGSTLLKAARRRQLGPHVLAGLGAVAAALDRCDAALSQSAVEIDTAQGEPTDHARRRAESVRATVVAGAEEVIARVGNAMGPGPLAHDGEHAQRVADLQVFVRQHHAERDLAALGELMTAEDEEW